MDWGWRSEQLMLDIQEEHKDVSFEKIHLVMDCHIITLAKILNKK